MRADPEATFDRLMREHAWRPISNCPGRFIFAAGVTSLSPAALVSGDAPVRSLSSKRARDPMLVVDFPDQGGLISYVKPAGRFLHTLNTASGLARKLEELASAPGKPGG